MKSFASQMQQYARVFADRIQHHGVAEAGRTSSKDRDCFGFKPFQVRVEHEHNP
jgi:hypothetical protein